MIRHSIDAHTQPIPSVLEIPSKDHPYDATKDSILRRAKVMYINVLNNYEILFGSNIYILHKNENHKIHTLR